MSLEHSTVPKPGEPPLGRIALDDRLAALSFALRGVLWLALLGAGILGLEALVLAYPARLGPELDGFPTDRVLELSACAGQIVFIGDSVVQTVATHDTDTRVIPAMLEDELDGAAVRRISGAATAAELHRAWLRYLGRIEVPPHAVVIEVNPRSFSPHWERNPSWVFDDQAAMIDHPLFARLASVLEWEWHRPTDEEYRETPVFVRGALAGTIAELERPGVGWETPGVGPGRYLVRYGADYALGRRVHALRALVDEANASPFPVVLFLTPIDVDAVRTNLTAEQVVAVEENLALLRSELARSRWPTVDASVMVTHEDFDHPDGDPHEHLKAAGRALVAHALAEAMRTLDDRSWH